LLTPFSIDDIIVGLLLNSAGGLDRISTEPGVQLGLGKVKPLALRMARFEGRFFIASQNSVIYIF